MLNLNLVAMGLSGSTFASVFGTSESSRSPWVAGSYGSFKGKLGTFMHEEAQLFELPLGGVAAKPANAQMIDVPESFDSRTKWPDCPSIGAIRNQGHCG